MKLIGLEIHICREDKVITVQMTWLKNLANKWDKAL